MSTPTCPYCGADAKLVTGAELYPNHSNTKLAYLKFWRCDPCDAHVGCHLPLGAKGSGMGDGTLPLGTLANAPLRKARTAAHKAFDGVWKSGYLQRRQAYGWLAKQLGIPPTKCHIGSMDVAGCNRVIQVVYEKFPLLRA